MRILFVDDEEGLAEALAQRAGYRGMEADWTLSGKAALEMVQNTHYDVAVLDVRMPKLDGIELKHRMREVSPETRVIFLTACGSEENFKAGMEAVGRQYYLIKPVSFDQLMAKVQEIMAD
jgi:DNA-binding response OmpR family regulator